MVDRVYVTDVTLRDGLQSQAKILSTAEKVQLYTLLRDCGYERLEITSFVNPKRLPQFADSAALLQELQTRFPEDAAKWMAFVPNEVGMERLQAFPIAWAGAFVSTSETFNQKNVGQSIAESMRGLAAVAGAAKRGGRRLRVYVSTAFGCPYEKAAVLPQTPRVLSEVAGLAPDEIAISDTIGVATPLQVESVLGEMAKSYPLSQVSLHLHNTYGLATASAQRAFEMGVRRFDGATGGLGGCPYAQGASGNLASELLLYQFSRQGKAEFSTESIRAALRYMTEVLQLELPSSLAEIYKKGGEWYGIATSSTR